MKWNCLIHMIYIFVWDIKLEAERGTYKVRWRYRETGRMERRSPSHSGWAGTRDRSWGCELGTPCKWQGLSYLRHPCWSEGSAWVENWSQELESRLMWDVGVLPARLNVHFQSPIYYYRDFFLLLLPVVNQKQSLELWNGGIYSVLDALRTFVSF